MKGKELNIYPIWFYRRFKPDTENENSYQYYRAGGTNKLCIAHWVIAKWLPPANLFNNSGRKRGVQPYQ
jgi:hypothetical protein